jgi:outer membrane protein assembly factor BamB
VKPPVAVGTALVAGAMLLVGCGNSHRITHDVFSPAAGGVSKSAATVAATVPDGDWPQFGYDAQRTGVGPARTGITAANLRLLKRRVVHVDGTVDSAAIQLHGVVIRGRPRDALFVTTTYGKTVALDAATGSQLWEFTPPDIGGYEGSYRITTATPAADPDRRYIYSTSPDGVVHKLSVATGQQVTIGHWPVRVTFDPTKEKLASPPSIDGSALLVVTGGYIGDAPTYQGHVVKIDRASGRIEAVFNALCSNIHRLINPPTRCPQSASAIWARAGAVIEPGSGNVLVATGNGDFNGSTDWGDSVLELSPSLTLLHNWTPTDQYYLEQNDTDVGSTAPALLPPVGRARLAVQGGKNSLLALLDLDRLDGTTRPAGPGTGGQLQQAGTPGGGGVLSAPAVWQHAGRDYLFVAEDSGTGAFVLGADRRLHPVWKRSTPGTSPVIAGGLLYVYDFTDGGLVIRRPSTGEALATLRAGTGHWNSPIVVGGRIIEPEGNANDHATSGVIDIYHLPGR